MIFYVSFFFFFKQKTAYEMRISDWSSDVCSSDLRRLAPVGERSSACPLPRTHIRCRRAILRRTPHCPDGCRARKPRNNVWCPVTPASSRGWTCAYARPPLRSEEHTSELQSLMRISYAVFCLKKKKKKTNRRT